MKAELELPEVELSNQRLLRKANLALKDLLNDGVLIQPAQAQKFVDLCFTQAKFNEAVRQLHWKSR